MLFYSYCDDVPALREHLMAEGVQAGPIQYSFYAPGGEFRIQDPDGFVIMVTHTKDTIPEKGGSMAKELRCGDLMPGCTTVVEGKDDAEVMTRAAEHAKTAHGLQQIPPELAGKVLSAIKEKDASQRS